MRHGRSNRVSYGTALRLLSSVTMAVFLVMFGNVSGASAGALILMAGVVVEAIATHLMAAGVVRDNVLTTITPDGQPPLTLARITQFHAPLAATTLLSFLIQPVTAAALARLAMPRETLAAWPVIFSTMLVLRGWGLAIQETTIAQAKAPQLQQPLRDFTLVVAGVTSLAAALLVWTPLLNLHLQYVIGLAPELRDYVRLGIQISVLLPAITAMTSWLRGLLVATGSTGRVYRGMLTNLVVNCAVLALGVALGLPGVIVAATGLSLASAAEYAYLRRPVATTPIPSVAPGLSRL